MNKTNIEYVDFSWNPIVMRCASISEGCKNCWRLRMADRLAGNDQFSENVRFAYSGDGPPLLPTKRLDLPRKRKKPARIAVQFMGDLFHDKIPYLVIQAVSENPQRAFLILAKRSERMFHYFHGENVLDYSSSVTNLWLGVTVENQETAAGRREFFKRAPAFIKYVSYEPALGPIDWSGWDFVDWIINGGESGPRARPSHPDWHRTTRDFCQKHSIACHFKQWGTWVPHDHYADQPYTNWGCLTRSGDFYPLTTTWNGRQGDPRDDYEYSVYQVGKKRAGCLLDGREWSEFPR